MSLNKDLVILVTGFGPFGCYKTNPASVTAKILGTLEYPPNLKVITHEIPVDYDYIDKELPKLRDQYKPDIIIHIGVGCQKKSIYIEQSAFNYGYVRQDINNRVPLDNECVKDAPNVLNNHTNLNKCILDINQSKDIGIIFELSNDPGRYLCGYVYYKSLVINPRRALFIHIPPPDEKELGCEMLYANTIRILILYLCEHINML